VRTPWKRVGECTYICTHFERRLWIGLSGYPRGKSEHRYHYQDMCTYLFTGVNKSEAYCSVPGVSCRTNGISENCVKAVVEEPE